MSLATRLHRDHRRSHVPWTLGWVGLGVWVGFGTPVGLASSPIAPPDRASPVVLTIPARPHDAMGGVAFIEHLRSLDPRQRQAAILAEVQRGNIPRFLRTLRPVELVHSSRHYRHHRATVWVMPDYLSIGSDTDFVRIPVDFYTAAAVAQTFGLSLPTRKIVDAVYRQAPVRLTPIPMRPGPRMRSPGYVLTHHRRIERVRAQESLGTLVAGHKKDLVLTKRLGRRPPRVAIYGWHRHRGRPIQPLSTVHGASYADYSHGVRFISQTVLIDDEPRLFYDVLADRRLARLLSDEGTIPQAQQLLAPRG